jgi:hypothetical protein
VRGVRVIALYKVVLCLRISLHVESLVSSERENGSKRQTRMECRCADSDSGGGETETRSFGMPPRNEGAASSRNTVYQQLTLAFVTNKQK